MKQDIKLVIFDFNGVITQDFNGKGEMLKEFGSKNLFRLYFTEKQGNSKIRKQALRKVKEITYRTIDNLTLEDNFIEFFNSKKLNGSKKAILSLSPHKLIYKVLDKYDMADQFDIIVGIEDVKSFKPSPSGLKMILNNFKISKNETLFIGDDWTDRIAGLLAGVRTFLSIEDAKKYLT